MDKEFLHHLYSKHQEAGKCLPPEMIARWFNELLGLLFPERNTNEFNSEDDFTQHAENLQKELVFVLEHCEGQEGSEAATRFFDRLPGLKTALDLDLEATFQGDPAAHTRSVVARSYPGFYAIAAYRTAHVLNALGVRMMPRAITEYAHERTGIDIHPAATIGAHFCIDHGTGIVIGETTVIGEHVKLYQGVTLGALSVDKRDASSKRHPTIEDEVVIYAGATILGGQTTVGKGSIIGGNVWLTRSVPASSKVYYSASMSDEQGSTDRIVIKP